MSYNVNEHIKGGFFKALFDFQFTEWVTLRVAGVLYAVVVALTLVAAIVLFGALWFNAGAIGFVLFVIGVPIFWIVGVLLWRLVFEAAIATIAIAKNTEALKK